MTSPNEALKAGIESIGAFLREFGLEFVLGESGIGSGGSFVRGALVAVDGRVNLSFRHGLGEISLERAGFKISFEDYLLAVGAYSEARFPSTRKGAPDRFEALAHDLAEYCTEFLQGETKTFNDVVHRGQKKTRNPMIDYVGDTRARERAREAFRSEDYDEVVRLMGGLQYPEDLSASEKKMYGTARSRSTRDDR